MKENVNTVEQFNRIGWAIAKNFLNKKDIEVFADVCRPMALELEKEFGTSKNKNLVYSPFSSFGTRSLLKKIYKHEIVQKIFSSREFRQPFIEHVKVLGKAGGGADTPWHQDSDFWKDRDPKKTMFTVWIAITDVTIQNGCMIMAEANIDDSLPHKIVRNGKERELENADFFDSGSVMQCELKPGDALVFNSTAPHCALPNVTQDARLAIKVVFQDFHQRPEVERLDLTSVSFNGGIKGMMNSIIPCSYSKLRMVKNDFMKIIRG